MIDHQRGLKEIRTQIYAATSSSGYLRRLVDHLSMFQQLWFRCEAAEMCGGCGGLSI